MASHFLVDLVLLGALARRIFYAGRKFLFAMGSRKYLPKEQRF